MEYTKQPIDLSGQVETLKERGLIIEDEQYTLECLRIISYFRLANYLRPMEYDKVVHRFKPDSRFENAISLYYFDKKLRTLLFTVIQSIEIALRTKIIHHFSLQFGAFWFMNESLFKDDRIFGNCLHSIKEELCHHARLWNRRFPMKPQLPKKLPEPWIARCDVQPDKIYVLLCCLASLLDRIYPHNTFKMELKDLLKAYPNVDANAMGFPSDWQSEAIWKG